MGTQPPRGTYRHPLGSMTAEPVRRL